MRSSYNLFLKSVKFSCALFIRYSILIAAQPHYPIDVSYLVADVKYSQEHGLKICEVQHGSLSALDGDLYLHGGHGTIAPLIADFFTLFQMKKWAVGLIYAPLKKSLAARGWIVESSLKTLLAEPTFLACAAAQPANPFSLPSYAGIVYADLDLASNINFYRNAYPGIIFINAATFPYWLDKYMMNTIFDLNDELKQYKAEWRLCTKNYDPLLSERIQGDLPAQLYVIKPRREALANGVIVVAKNDLDSVLRMILQPCMNLKKHPDKKYAYWYKNNDDTFIIEKYYESDYVYFTHPLHENIPKQTEYHYDATMRIVFILKYDEKRVTYHSLGGYWKLPFKALEEDGTLNEKRISYCKPPFYKAVDPALFKEVNTHMERAMLLLYEIIVKRLTYP